jgi:rfaE bifunctional protein kinase chain/domain
VSATTTWTEWAVEGDERLSRRRPSSPDSSLAPLQAQFSSRLITVVGDVMIDRTIHGEVGRVSPEAPILVFEAGKMAVAPGGAANAAMNVRALGGRVRLFGIVGDDDDARMLRGTLSAEGIDPTGLITDPGRPTTSKTRFVARGQQVLRVDRESRVELADELAAILLRSIEPALATSDVLLVSDYAKGVHCESLLPRLIRMARTAGVPVIVDPKGRDYSLYVGASVMTPNESEAMEFLEPRNLNGEDPLALVAASLLTEVGCRAVLVTRGEKGMVLFERGESPRRIPALPRSLFDSTGAGDTVAAAFSLALAVGASLHVCADVANKAAALVVGKPGTATVSAAELAQELGPIELPTSAIGSLDGQPAG